MTINLKEIQNKSCHTKCNRQRRQSTTLDDLCIQTNSEIDELPVRCVGEWAVEKIFHLVQYFGIFSNGMKNAWGGKINYIEICSGPGRCINRTTGIEFNGTSMCILEHNALQYLNKALFFDFNPKVISSLNTRIQEKGIKNAKAILGDYNNAQELCDNIKREISENGLNLIFIDPTDCSLPFELIKTLKLNLKNADLIINLAIGTDYNRNVKKAILNPTSHVGSIQKYSKFINNSDFFTRDNIVQFANNGQNQELRLAIRNEYMNSLRNIGYKYFDFKLIRNYYDLIFASSHEKGLEFWKKANKNEFDGQRIMDF